MFDPTNLSEIVELHQRSHALLLWVRDALKSGRVSFAIIHQNTDSASTAAEWIERHFNNIPSEARPSADQIPDFARLFVSFLTTSYRLTSNSVRMESGCGCWCSYCAYVRAGPNLQSRIPSKKDVIVATELKRIYLDNLANELGIADVRSQVDTILNSPEISEDLSVATWGTELLRRSKFVSQGEAVLALWRQFAYKNLKPRQKFKITASRILLAEANIISKMRTPCQFGSN